MKQVTVTFIEGDAGNTFSKLSTDGFECYVVELAWIDADKDGKRDRNVSRIAGGKYDCKYTKSPSRKKKDGTAEWSYELQNVPDADGVRIHAANWADQLKACLALGRAIMDIKRPDGTMKKGVSSSGDTIRAFENHMGREPFEITITREVA
mgnify:FL=1